MAMLLRGIHWLQGAMILLRTIRRECKLLKLQSVTLL